LKKSTAERVCSEKKRLISRNSGCDFYFSEIYTFSNPFSNGSFLPIRDVDKHSLPVWKCMPAALFDAFFVEKTAVWKEFSKGTPDIF
jgi:hypothetical protein